VLLLHLSAPREILTKLDGKIIGQGGPSDEVFSKLWYSLARKYTNQSKVMFGLMNEPWGVNITQWSQTIQSAVNAIVS
jgi:endoglucanase